MQPVAGRKGSKVTYLDEDIEAFERQIRHPAAWAIPAPVTRKARRKSNLDADQIEHEQALASLEREFGLKINK